MGCICPNNENSNQGMSVAQFKKKWKNANVGNITEKNSIDISLLGRELPEKARENNDNKNKNNNDCAEDYTGLIDTLSINYGGGSMRMSRISNDVVLLVIADYLSYKELIVFGKCNKYDMLDLIFIGYLEGLHKIIGF